MPVSNYWICHSQATAPPCVDKLNEVGSLPWAHAAAHARSKVASISSQVVCFCRSKANITVTFEQIFAGRESIAVSSFILTVSCQSVVITCRSYKISLAAAQIAMEEKCE